MDFNFDTGTIYGGLQTLDVTTLPPLGGTAGVLTIIGNGALTLPSGTTAEEPGSAVAGMFRYNTDTTKLEYFNGTLWDTLSTSSGSVSSVAANSNSSSLTISGSPITSAGTFQFTLDAGLEALGTFSTTGLLVATGTNTWASRTLTGTSGNIAVTDGDGIAGNPTVNLATVSQAATGDFVKVTLDGFGRVSGNTPVVQSDITTLVDSVYVNVAGATMTGDLDMDGNSITNLPTPVNGGDATNKDYVDALSNGLSWKTSVTAATTANIALSGLQTIDGVAVTAGQRVLVKSQTLPENNGIYVVAAGSWTRSTDMDSTTPVNEINGAAVFVEQGTLNADTAWVQIDDVQVLGTDPLQFVQFAGAGAYTAGNGLQLIGNQFSLVSPVTVSNGGTGLSTAPTNGQLLIGNGTGYTLSTLTDGTAISITEGAGTITISNTGVVSLTGTANEVEVSASTGAITIGLPDDVTIANTLTVSGLTPNGAVYPTTGGLLVSTAALTDGQILIGDTSGAPIAATLTAGNNVSITNGAGSITIATINDGTVTSVDVSGGTTGLTTSGGPITSSGTITLSGTVATGHGGTGLSSIGTANQVLGVNAGATGLEYKSISAGTGISVTNGANVITIANTGVTSVALSDASTTPIYTVSGSPVTTTGTLTLTLASQAANTAFLAPNGSSGQPTFRAITAADLETAIQLYAENPSTPTAPVSTGANAVAIGSGATATAAGSFAEGDGTDARIFGQKAFANGSFATAGDAQHGIYVARNITTDDTSTELFLDGTATQLVMPDNSLFTFDILVAARRTDATGGGAAYRFVGVAKKDATAGSVTFVGTPSKTVVGETNAAWDAAVSVDTTTGAFRVTVTGETAKTIRWVATIQTTEVTN